MTQTNGHETYEIAFEIGGIGMLILLSVAYAGPTVVGIIALIVWIFMTEFIIPWVYIWTVKEITYPEWFIRGPHQ